jgi:hypothetical protein
MQQQGRNWGGTCAQQLRDYVEPRFSRGEPAD